VPVGKSARNHPEHFHFTDGKAVTAAGGFVFERADRPAGHSGIEDGFTAAHRAHGGFQGEAVDAQMDETARTRAERHGHRRIAEVSRKNQHVGAAADGPAANLERSHVRDDVVDHDYIRTEALGEAQTFGSRRRRRQQVDLRVAAEHPLGSHPDELPSADDEDSGRSHST